VHIGTRYEEVDHRPPNVAGIVRGSDPALRDSYVVVSAHFDHVGVGRPDARGDSIYNGADDNGTGTAALLELAQAFAAMPVKPGRSILLLAVSGEEKGLLGSAYYGDNPTVPREAIVANINVDMIGRNAPDSIVAIGVEFSSLGPLTQRIGVDHPELGLTVSDDLWPEQNFFFRSDHYSFARHEIPAIFFFAGVHEDYHRPSDTVDRIDGDKTARVTRLVLRLAHAIASDAQPPQWTDEGLRRVRELTARGR
jgi:Zn-dependent M28 family amino/carboxypeptidase